MKKMALTALSVLVIAALACGCAQNGGQTPAQPDASTTASRTEESTGRVYFEKGVYQVYINDEFKGDYYIFYDTESGKTANASTGMGLGFTCEQTDGQVTFHMGGAEETTVMTMSGESGRCVGTTAQNETYTFIRTPEDADTFEATDAGITKNTDGDTQNPIMNFIGDYSNGRAMMTILPSGKDAAKITVKWAGSALDNSTWEMSGPCVIDENTLTVAYTDCVKTNRSYNADGSVQSETVEYKDGSGRITIELENSQITWADDQEDVGADQVFTGVESAQ
jgi:hypothetical protein